jgi:hypothetical protein
LLLRSRDAALALAVSERMLDELRRNNELHPIRLPGRGISARALRYVVSDLEAFIARQQAGQLSVRGRPAWTAPPGT